MTRVMLEEVDFTNEAPFQRYVIKLAYRAGWGMPKASATALDEGLESFGQAPAPLDGLVFHPAIMYRSEPGWPDLTLFRLRDRRLIFAELKTDKGKIRPRQSKVLVLLRHFETGKWDCANHTGHAYPIGDEPRCRDCLPLIQVFLWRPADLDEIQRVLE